MSRASISASDRGKDNAEASPADRGLVFVPGMGSTSLDEPAQADLAGLVSAVVAALAVHLVLATDTLISGRPCDAAAS